MNGLIFGNVLGLTLRFSVWCVLVKHPIILTREEYISAMIHLVYKYYVMIDSVWIFCIIVCSSHYCLLACVLSITKRERKITNFNYKFV